MPGLAFGHHSVCKIIVFFILTLFVVDNKMVGNNVVDLKFSKETLCGIFQSSMNEKSDNYAQMEKAQCALCKIC